MRLLLDTQCWLWLAASPERLSAQARTLVEAEEHQLHLSAASAWEIAIKYAIRRLPLHRPPHEYVPDRSRQLRVSALPIEQLHALHVASLPRHHRDPFDRLIIAQAQIDELTILTSDPQFAAYDVPVIPAS